ncbi:hypothetical protein CDD83_3951 [Cordyceps sp. RAO-2017]|nr:hypothetical protein CDD83_3951 [Cordyceps sp. RAO-2017]
MAPALDFPCANWSADNKACKGIGGFSCGSCRLVNYCSPDCQRAHWACHKTDCKQPLGKPSWQPDWVREGRLPSFVSTPGTWRSDAGNAKCAWGSIPAFDLLRLGANEGSGHAGDLRLLFAASGDLRNVVETVAKLPGEYGRCVRVTVNDWDLDVVARNVLLLLVALGPDAAEAKVDCMIHVWYSALVRDADLALLRGRVRPLLEGVCARIRDKPPKRLVGKTWTLGRVRVRLVLERQAWDGLLAYLDVPAGLTAAGAREARASVLAAADRADLRHRKLMLLSSSHRIAAQRYLDDGLLLPFAAPRAAFRQPNPTLFRRDGTWLVSDACDPHRGWSAEAVAETSSGPATADLFGKLFFHLRKTLRTFLARLAQSDFFFQFFQQDVAALAKHLKRDAFDRIEVSSIADRKAQGIEPTLLLMLPLLQPACVNPHATLVSLFADAVSEMTTEDDMVPKGAVIQHLSGYMRLSHQQMTSNLCDPQLVKVIMAHGVVRSHEDQFDQYMRKHEFRRFGAKYGGAMKTVHTIVAKWPFRLELLPGQPGAQEEFDRLLQGGHSGEERFVEWRRTAG